MESKIVMSHGPSDFKLSNIKRALVGAKMAGVAVDRIEIKGGKITVYPSKEVQATNQSDQSSDEWNAPRGKTSASVRS